MQGESWAIPKMSLGQELIKMVTTTKDIAVPLPCTDTKARWSGTCRRKPNLETHGKEGNTASLGFQGQESSPSNKQKTLSMRETLSYCVQSTLKLKTSTCYINQKVSATKKINKDFVLRV